MFIFYFQLERLKYLEAFCKELAAINPEYALKDDDWKELSDILPVLEIASKKMLAFQKKDLKLSDVYGHWLDMELRLKKLPSCELIESILKSMESRSKDVNSNVLMKACVFLDPRFQLMLSDEDTERAIQHLICLYNRLNGIDENSNATAATSSQNETQSDENISVLERFLQEKENENSSARINLSGPNIANSSNIRQKLVDFHGVKRLESDEDVLSFWLRNRFKNPELYQLANVLFSVAPTEVSVERLFSLVNFILNELRTCLADEKLENILLCKYNKDLFD